MPNPLDISNQKYGRLFALNYSHTENSKRYWTFRCDCGAISTKRVADVTQGKTRSCGCFDKETRSSRAKTHGLTNTQLHTVWLKIRSRCNSRSDKAYPQYGGRGIALCERWNDFENFRSDMGERPSDKHSIERIDNNKGYSPDNCRWATADEQNRNTRQNRWITFQRRKYIISDLARHLGVDRKTLQHRVESGWTEAELSLPPDLHRKRKIRSTL